jgi:hypothetical protein
VYPGYAGGRGKVGGGACFAPPPGRGGLGGGVAGFAGREVGAGLPELLSSVSSSSGLRVFEALQEAVSYLKSTDYREAI